MTIAKALIDALGGHLNIVEIEPCTMRIRVQVKTQRAVDEAALRVDGVLAVVRSDDVASAMIASLESVAHDTPVEALSQRAHA